MKKILSLLLILMIFLPVQTVVADRGSIPFKPGINIYEPGQTAIIGWNGQEEILILSTDIHASEKTKVLEVLPLPSEPEVKKAEPKVFKNINDLITKLNLENFLKDFEVLRNSKSQQQTRMPAGEVTQHKQIGVHDISVTHVNQKQGFIDWVNNYLKEQGAENVKIPLPLAEVISEYLEEGYRWFVFDVIELDQTTVTNPGIQYRFRTDGVYYPLKITRAETGATNIKLAIISSKVLNNFRGLKSTRLAEGSNHYRVSYTDISGVSQEIASLFENNKKLSLYDWTIKGELSSFNRDLLVNHREFSVENTYLNTSFINCHPHPEYPFNKGSEVKTITGKVTEKVGSRMYPWRAAVVNDLPLFNPLTGTLLKNYDKLKGKQVSITGYPGQGHITMKNPVNKMDKIIEFKRVFYVEHIIGWELLCGDSINEYGEIISESICFWNPASD